MNKFKIGDRVIDAGRPGTIRETPRHDRNYFQEYYLIEYDDKAYGHNGIGYNVYPLPLKGGHWELERHLQFTNAPPPTPFDLDLQAYIAAEMALLR